MNLVATRTLPVINAIRNVLLRYAGRQFSFALKDPIQSLVKGELESKITNSRKWKEIVAKMNNPASK